MTRSMRWRYWNRGSEEGSALLLVLAGMALVFTIAIVSLGYAMSNYNLTRHVRDDARALVAAEAGVDDYIARNNILDTYWQTPDCTNVALQRPMPKNPATGAPYCNWGPSTTIGWATVYGSDNDESFHYDADISTTYTNGAIDFKSTGKSGKATRTLETTLRRNGFGEFLYDTVYETVDPSNTSQYGNNNTTAATKCPHYFWEPNNPPSSIPRDTSYCSDINFITGDVINGPLHSNDSILMSGSPHFQGTVTTSDPGCRPTQTANGPAAPPVTSCYRTVSGGATPIFDKGIAYAEPVTLPTGIGSIRQYVDGTNANPGCLYTGPTRIRLQGSKMQVWSPFSKTIINPACGNAAAAWPQTVNIPNNNLILVQNVPSSQNTPASGTCPTGSIGDSLPQAGDLTGLLDEANCRYGTAYVQGDLSGKITISADNNIVVTGNLTYDSGPNGTDTLGLIASNSVKIYHPIAYTLNSQGQLTSATDMKLPWTGATFDDPVVQASILTLQHSFTVQWYQLGQPHGTIHLYGSFAQMYRGPVGTGTGSVSTGYLKDYVYDTRLRYAPPPYFLDPVHSSWGVKTFGEIAAQYH